MRDMASASPCVAALACMADIPAPLTNPTILEHAWILRRKVDGHRQSAAPPVREASGAALVLLHQEPPRQLVFLRVAGFTGQSTELLPRDADGHPGSPSEVPHPVRAVSASREHVEGPRFGNECEPDLDLVWSARDAPRGRQITEILLRERPKINHQGFQASGLRFMRRAAATR